MRLIPLLHRLLLGFSLVVSIAWFSSHSDVLAKPALSHYSLLLIDLIKPASSDVWNHSALGLLRSPVLHSDWKQANATFDFFVPAMPQSGVSKIVFASNREGSMQIYVMNGDGSGVARLTNSGANDDFPRWSHDGWKILFQSDRDNRETGYMDIYVMNPDGSGVARLTSDPNDDSMGTWSPDGSRVVFQSLRNGSKYQVYVMNADGSNHVNLSNSSANDGEPAWSPDGMKMAFVSDRDREGFKSIYVMNSDGTNQQRVTFSSGDVQDGQPAWSPDGTRIAFVSTRDSIFETWQETDDDGNYITKSKLDINKEVYVMNADGSGQTRLTDELANDDAPSWSPDGSKIVFRSDRERDCCDPIAQVWTMNADGTSQTDLSNSGNGDYIASWTLGGVIDTPFGGGTRETPVANPGGPYNSQTGQIVQLNGSGSFDPNGTITNYSWDFGDGTSGTGSIVNHQYNSAGVYPVSLTVTDNTGNSASSQAFVSVDSAAFPVRIDFDRFPDGTAVPNNTIIADQYLAADGVRFYSDNPFTSVHTSQSCGFCSTTSLPNFIWTAPNITGQTIVEFTQPASNLSFSIIGIDVFFDQFAVIDVYRNNSPYGSLAVFGNGTTTKGINFVGLDNITKIVIRSISDPFGIGFDDFSFNVPADVKITSGRVNGYLNGTTQNALLGADVALNASPLPGAFSGGTYTWSCAPVNQCSIVSPSNSSSVTMRFNEVGTFTATVTYTRSGVQTSSSLTINSALPTLTSFTGNQVADQVTQGPQPGLSNPCGDVFPFWLYRLGCGAQEGMAFDASVHAQPGFISDPSKSGIKYVQAIKTFSKEIKGGNLLCNMLDPANNAPGWELDSDNPFDPYVLPGYPVHYFSEGNDLSMHTHDYPDYKLTRVLDNEMRDALYVDDQFEMYVVYFAGNPNSPNAGSQRPLGKVPWNRGGLVVFDPPGQHRIRSSLTIAGPKTGIPTNSMVSLNGRAQNNQFVPCVGAPLPTNNLIDSSRVFVRFHYKDFLGRDPDGNPNEPFDFENTDLPGWKFWTSQISQCAFDLSCIDFHRANDGLSFFLSGEFVHTDPNLANPPGSPNFNPPVYNRAFVKICYLKYLHRDPADDPDGWNFWTNDLNSNGDYLHTIKSFLVSTEYRGRADFTTSYEKF